jgi:hypothetical protein
MPRVCPTSDEFPSPQDREHSRFISAYLWLDFRSAVDALAVQQRGELSRPALPLQAPWDPWAAQFPGDVAQIALGAACPQVAAGNTPKIQPFKATPR